MERVFTCSRDDPEHIFVEGILNAAARFLRSHHGVGHQGVLPGILQHKVSWLQLRKHPKVSLVTRVMEGAAGNAGDQRHKVLFRLATLGVVLTLWLPRRADSLVSSL